MNERVKREMAEFKVQRSVLILYYLLLFARSRAGILALQEIERVRKEARAVEIRKRLEAEKAVKVAQDAGDKSAG